MKQFILLVTAFLFTTFSYAQKEIKSMCGSNINIEFTTKGKYKVYKSEPSQLAKEHSLSPVACSYRLTKTNGKSAISFRFHDNEIDSFYKVQIDSCFQDTTINGREVKFCRYRSHGIKFLIAQTTIESRLVDIYFDKKDYGFLLELLEGMKITKE